MRDIPYFDARRDGPAGFATARANDARELRDACLRGVPKWTHRALRPVDAISADWLRRTPSPYYPEIREIVARTGLAGVFAINMGYQYACTTGVAPGESGPPLMRRVLDWSLPGLGRGVAVVHQSGPAGDFYNVTWPGAAGVLTAAAPGRFVAAINQAPMYRRTRAASLVGLDLLLNLQWTLTHEHGWPPDHLLRYAFETCRDLSAAVELLSREPLARPALFSLAGVSPGESVLIERTERGARVYAGEVAVANDWRISDENWRPRARPGAEPRADNRTRVALMREANAGGDRGFSWLRSPILNQTTRVAVEMSARPADLRAIGFEPNRESGSADRVTSIFDLARAGDVRAAA